jgi:hypothetical protein
VEHIVQVAKVGTKSLTFEHRMQRGDICLMEATVVRVWDAYQIAEPDNLETLSLPHVRALLTRPRQAGPSASAWTAQPAQLVTGERAITSTA